MRYLDYETLLELYFYIVRDVMHSVDAGILSEDAVRSALARPQHAAHYEDADGFRQAAFLFHGLIKAHGFLDGNKRAAFLGLGWFLHNNCLGKIDASTDEIVSFCLRSAEGVRSIEDIEAWLREHVQIRPTSSETLGH